MSTFLELALDYTARGWHVFPCLPRKKKPLIEGGSNWCNASSDEVQVREWWTKWPEANVAIAGNGSGLAVLDVDHGLKDAAELRAWCERNGIPQTYTVRTGRRPEFGVQMYFAGVMPDVGIFHLDGCSGQVKSQGGYVMAAGSIHPDSGERYEVICDVPLAPLPDCVRALCSTKKEKANSGNPKVSKTAWTLPVHEGDNRTSFLMEQTGQMRNLGCGFESILAHMRELNDDPDIITDPISEDRLQATAANCAKFPVPPPPPEVRIGGGKEPETPKDWRELFHSKEDALNAPPVTFLIEGFLQREGVTAIAAPVRERKSLIALNIVHALLTGEKLFDHFDVVKQPERVLYLCPEVSLGPFTDRVKKIGLMDYVGRTFFYRTLSADGHVKLNDETLKPALPGSVVVLDTAIRFLEGDENSSEDVRAFADSIFALLRAGAEAVILLHHSPKNNGDSMTLENAMRGSGDMGAFLACCWGTRLQDPSKPYESASFLSNLKQRDFQSQDFEVTSGEDCRLHIVGDPTTRAVTLQPRKGNKGNKDGMDEAAEAVIRANLKVPLRKLQEQLAALGIERGTTWIGKARARITGTGVTCGEAA